MVINRNDTRIGDFEYTLLSKKHLGNAKVVKPGNIQHGYKVPAWRQTVEYSKDIIAYIKLHGGIAGYKNTSYARTLYIDLDRHSKSLEQLFKDTWFTLEAWKEEYELSPEAVQIFYSGKKGVHLHIPTKIFGLTPQKNLPIKLKQFVSSLFKGTHAEDYLDMDLFQFNSWVRIANSPHQETNHFKVAIQWHELPTLTRAAATKRSQKQFAGPVPTKSGELGRNVSLSALWNNAVICSNHRRMQKPEGAVDGTRHHVMLPIIRKCWWRHYTESETEKYIINWDENENKPPMFERSSMRKTIGRWYSLAESLRYQRQSVNLGLHDELLSILGHPELTVLESGVLMHIFRKVNRVERDWNRFRVLPGSGIFVRKTLSAELGITPDQFDSIRKRMRNLGLLYSYPLPYRKGLYITLGPPLRNLKIGRDSNLDNFQLPPQTYPHGRWETRPRDNLDWVFQRTQAAPIDKPVQE